MTTIARIATSIGVAVALAACGGGDDSSSGSSANTPTPSQSNSPAPSGSATQSLNWRLRQILIARHYSAISGSWIVPDVQCSGNANSATWLGIGGGNGVDPTLVQAGTSQDCSGSDKTFYAWWEALPAPQVQADGALLATGNFPVSPGDLVTVTINSTLVIWNITIVNATAGWTFNQTIPYLSAGDTAEWIEEAPLSAGTGGAGQMPLANFGTVGFSSLTVNGANPSFRHPRRARWWTAVVMCSQARPQLLAATASTSAGAPAPADGQSEAARRRSRRRAGHADEVRAAEGAASACRTANARARARHGLRARGRGLSCVHGHGADAVRAWCESSYDRLRR